MNPQDPACEALIQQIHKQMQEACGEMVRIPDNCFAMIRLPLSFSVFSSFYRAAERISPNCVTKQIGQLLMFMHAPKEGAQ